MGGPLVYRPTRRLLQLVEVETLEEARRKLGVPTDYGYAWDRSPRRYSRRRRPSECSSRMKTRSWFAARSGGVLLERPTGRGPGLPMAPEFTPRCSKAIRFEGQAHAVGPPRSGALEQLQVPVVPSAAAARSPLGQPEIAPCRSHREAVLSPARQ
jgi:hypothetical protein